MEGLSRRGLLAGAAAGVAAPILASPFGERHRRPGHHHNRRVLRIAHLTDIHLKPEGKGVDRLTECLKTVNSLTEKPDVIFQGGDIIMDALNEDHGRVEAQYDLVSGIFDRHNSLPVQHCIGNHDIWGWGTNASKLQDHDDFGKNYWLKWTGLEKPNRSFDAAGWHFVFLDSLMRAPKGAYTAHLGEQQLKWLEADFQAVPKTTPICMVSHVPILSACAALFGQYESAGYWHIPGALMHVDGRKIKDLMWKHPNVRLCLSGHTHLVNKVEYNGVTHYCGGSVCGAWWNGPMQETSQGFSLIDLHADGTFHTQYLTY